MPWLPAVFMCVFFVASVQLLAPRCFHSVTGRLRLALLLAAAPLCGAILLGGLIPAMLGMASGGFFAMCVVADGERPAVTDKGEAEAV